MRHNDGCERTHTEAYIGNETVLHM